MTEDTCVCNHCMQRRRPSGQAPMPLFEPAVQIRLLHLRSDYLDARMGLGPLIADTQPDTPGDLWGLATAAPTPKRTIFGMALD